MAWFPDRARLEEILDNFASLRILVIGDFFLDKYLIMERRLSETSLETGLEARQVTEVRTSPGAAGTVVNNLRAMGVAVQALGAIGDTGEGYELLYGLDAIGADRSLMISHSGLMTPTYIKAIMREADGREHELERMDIKNRSPLLPEIEAGIAERLQDALPDVHGVIVSEFVDAPNCGVITDQIRAELNHLALVHTDKVFTVDSRPRIGLFRNIVAKPNVHEARSALGYADDVDPDVAGMALARRTSRPVFITLGAKGMLVCEAESCIHVPTANPGGPIDIVGAGDSALAGITAALCVGATLCEAALVGNLVASVTIQQIGTTGTATIEQILAHHALLE